MSSLALSYSEACANPLDGKVTAGAATVESSGATLTVNQTTSRTAIEWQSFSIGASESVTFNQPDASSIALNRVMGQNPSEILGSLSANGQVFLLNPNGVLFGADAQVNVGGLLGSSLGMTDQDFMAGNNTLTGDSTAGAIVNKGDLISATGGYVALIAPHVVNEGSIGAPKGTVALAAAEKVTLTLNSGSLVGVSLDQGTLNGLVENKTAIRADGGQVILTAKAMDQIARSVVNNTGIVEAATLSSEHGIIRLEASEVHNSGSLSANTIGVHATNDIALEAGSRLRANGAQGGDITVQSQAGTTLIDGVIEATGSDTTGGSIMLLGAKVGLTGSARIDASGESGGGTVLVGGDYQGKNPDVQNAHSTYVGADTTISADATTRGDGGTVIVWADDFTRFLGNISARGGALSGNGGFVETSGRNNLEALGRVDTSAPFGAIGNWLLDPANIDITNGGGTTGSFTGSPDSIFTPNQLTATLDAGTLSTALATNNVNVTTTFAGGEAGTITVSAPITRSAGTGTTTLTLTPAQATAGGTITIASTGAISGSADHPLNVNLAANGVGATVTVAAPITTFGGSFSSTGTTFTNNGGPITTSGGAINLFHTTTMTLASPLVSGGGDIVIAGGSTFTDTTQIDSGLGSVTLRGSTDTLAIGIGSTTGTFNITQAQIAGITASELTIGAPTGTAAIHIGTNEALNFGTKDVTFQNISGGMVVEGSAIFGSGDMTFVAGTGLFVNNQIINTSGDVNITADQVALNADIAGAGKLTISPFTASTAIEVGLAPDQIDFGAFSFNANSVTSTTRILQVGDTTNTGGITVVGPFEPGFSSLYLVTGGTIDIPLASSTVTATDLVLAGSTFNNAGPATLVTPGGRWLVYSTSPAGSTEGGLTAIAGSALPRLYNRTFLANGPETILEPGNHLIYSEQPTLAITADDKSRLYGDADPTFTYSSSGFVSDDGVTDTATTAGLAGTPSFTPAAGATTGVGTYAIVADFGGLTSGAGYGFTFADGFLTIDPATLSYVADPASRLYGDDNPSFTGTVTGFKNSENIAGATTGTLAFSSPAVPTSNVGSYAITGSGLTANNGNYVFAQDVANASALTINPATLSYLADLKSRLYGDPNPALTGRVTGFKNGEALADATTGTLNFSTLASAATNVGTYAITGSGLTADDGNYVFSQAAANATALAINPATLTYLADLKSRFYGDVNPTLTGTVTGFKNGETIASATTGTLTFTTPAIVTTNVGTSSIVGSGLSAANYAFVQALANATALTINQRGITLSADNTGRAYGAANPALTYQVTGGALVTGDVIVGTATTSATPASSVGPYAITQGTLTAGSNYALTFVDGILTVTPLSLTVTGDNKSRTYGDGNPALTHQVTSGSLVNGDTLSGSATTPATASSNVGNYAIGQGTVSAGSNYTVIFVDGTLSIGQRSITVTPNNRAKVYGNPDPTLTYVASSLGAGTPLLGTLERAAGENVGGYAINQGSLTDAANSNYLLEFVAGALLAITPRPLIISADDKVKAQGSANPPLTATAVGFANGENMSDLSGTLILVTAATDSSPQGIYAISPSGQSSLNYTITYVAGDLLVITNGLSGAGAEIEAAIASALTRGSCHPTGEEFATSDLRLLPPWDCRMREPKTLLVTDGGMRLPEGLTVKTHRKDAPPLRGAL